MTNKPLILVAFAITVLLPSCGLLPPAAADRNDVRPVAMLCADGRTMTLYKAKSWANAPDIRVNGKAVSVPGGTYKAEAEDSRYVYYRAPSSIEQKVVENVKINRQIFIGGIALPKSIIGTGGIYVDQGVQAQRVIIRALGNEFMLQEGLKWERNP